jgi:2'-5' RNA ligase
MGSQPNERSRGIPPEERLNIFALVIYIPGPLGKFLDDLRRELVPGCNPHAHISLLPPRPLAVDWSVASQQVSAVLEHRAPFEIELTGIEMFPVTDVAYIGVGDGAAELRRIHTSLNAAALEFQDPFPYHPHITVAQELRREDVAAINEHARRRWQEFQGERRFEARDAVFVQNSLNNCWIDLAKYTLGSAPAKS